MRQLWRSGEPFIWLTGGALAGSLLLVAGLIGLILANGLGFFWPKDVLRATLAGANLGSADFFKTVLDGADLAGANLIGARWLNCWQLERARNWQSAFRDPDLACGAAIPRQRDHP